MNPYWGLSGPILSWVACFETQSVMDFETTYQEAQRLIEAFWANSGQTEGDRTVQYALVALIDEMAMQKTWLGRYDWQQKPLQMVYFQDNCAGEGFFERLTLLSVMPAQAGIQSEYIRLDPSLPPAYAGVKGSRGDNRLDPSIVMPAQAGIQSERRPVEIQQYILEIYYFCLQMGFRGRYQFLPETAYDILMKELKILLHNPTAMVSCEERTLPTITPPAKHSYLRYQLLGVIGLGGLYLVLTLILYWQSDTLHMPDFSIIQEITPDV